MHERQRLYRAGDVYSYLYKKVTVGVLEHALRVEELAHL